MSEYSSGTGCARVKCSANQHQSKVAVRDHGQGDHADPGHHEMGAAELLLDGALQVGGQPGFGSGLCSRIIFRAITTRSGAPTFPLAVAVANRCKMCAAMGGEPRTSMIGNLNLRWGK